MNTIPTTDTLTNSLLWVYVYTPDQVYWCRTASLLMNCLDEERTYILGLLKARQPVIYPGRDIQFQPRPMTAKAKQRLEHLLTFEQGGFRLSSFQPESALFHKDGFEFFSMNEMGDRGILPVSSITHNKDTIPVYGPDGQLLDVFVPPILASICFITPDDEELSTSIN